MDLSAVAEFVRALAALLASGFAGSVVALRRARLLQRAGDVRSDVDDALAALRALRAAYRDAVAEMATVARLEDELRHAALRVGSEPVAEAADEYLAAGRPTTAGAEREAFDALTAALVAERRAYRP